MPGNEQSVQFSYAKTDGDKLIHIGAAIRNGKYLCPGCHEPMIPVLGEHKAKHFRHHKAVCSYESYLHQAAKMAIYHRLLNEDTVTLTLARVAQCKSPKADLFAGFHEPCNVFIPARYNLKTLFNQVELEHHDPETGLKPDVLLTNTNSKAKCYLEIYVTHPCSVEKISSGIPILEFHVTSEADITALISCELSVEETDLTHYNFKPVDRVVDNCLDECKNALVGIDIWSISPNGRLQKHTQKYKDFEHTEVSTSCAWPKALPSSLQLGRLRDMLQQADPAGVHANCLNCVFASNWDDGFLNCNKKHARVPYTEAKLCAQYRPLS
ncbi:hypothetical protein [Rheinheimera metallidurans]|uniref:competence protein CoiA family protein n=1 Tax=Rheinheimera metallidurans TaxID=2925781 RepID=UPI0030028B1C